MKIFGDIIIIIWILIILGTVGYSDMNDFEVIFSGKGTIVPTSELIRCFIGGLALCGAGIILASKKKGGAYGKNRRMRWL